MVENHIVKQVQTDCQSVYQYDNSVASADKIHFLSNSIYLKIRAYPNFHLIHMSYATMRLEYRRVDTRNSNNIDFHTMFTHLSPISNYLGRCSRSSMEPNTSLSLSLYHILKSSFTPILFSTVQQHQHPTPSANSKKGQG